MHTPIKRSRSASKGAARYYSATDVSNRSNTMAVIKQNVSSNSSEGFFFWYRRSSHHVLQERLVMFYFVKTNEETKLKAWRHSFESTGITCVEKVLSWRTWAMQGAGRSGMRRLNMWLDNANFAKKFTEKLLMKTIRKNWLTSRTAFRGCKNIASSVSSSKVPMGRDPSKWFYRYDYWLNKFYNWCFWFWPNCDYADTDWFPTYAAAGFPIQIWEEHGLVKLFYYVLMLDRQVNNCRIGGLTITEIKLRTNTSISYFPFGLSWEARSKKDLIKGKNISIGFANLQGNRFQSPCTLSRTDHCHCYHDYC